MNKIKFPIAFAIVFHIAFLSVFTLPSDLNASTAKQKYLTADSCYKKLNNSVKKQRLASEWINCISRYETIYRIHPESAWAPAGMYKASELYLKLHKRSYNRSHKIEAIDLLKRIIKKYPSSAYNSRARNLLKSLAVKPDQYTRSIPHKKAKKYLTKKGSLKDYEKKVVRPPKKTIITPVAKKPDPVRPDPPNLLPAGDTLVTDLRFWSNPEYTRIVVNADGERQYTHRLLKKDPTINVTFKRLYVDIENSRLAKNVAEHTLINDNLLERARAGQYTPHTVRVVVDIKSFDNYKIFSLKDPFRIVIDVWAKGANGKKPYSQPSVAVKKSDGTPQKTTRITTDNLKSSDIARQLALGVQKIVIDPGHGGRDPGAPGYFKNIWEKDIVLDLGKKLATTLRDRLKCTVELTRSSDRYLTLEERTAIANTKRADLFISLHCNAAKNRKLSGIETYILNLATDEKAIAVAARENATSKKNISDLEYILSDLMKHAKIEESTRLANDVHNAMVKGLRKKYSKVSNHGVKQAPFYVLLGARMPSILIESSFLSNPTECKRLMSPKYRAALCSAIADGIESYVNATNPKQL
ncbi:MAG: N-acetylmuramoyl-L-alanine amidase [Desulfobacteraceae bacterium]|nr:N-acetylmuramoyl-L-alanine amidase [Desulfobacteraceae bacterium]